MASRSQPSADAQERSPQHAYTLELGWMAKPLEEQLVLQGLPFDAQTIEHLQKDAEAASRLKVRGALTHSAGNAAYDRIIKRIWQEVRRAIKAGGTPVQADSEASPCQTPGGTQ